MKFIDKKELIEVLKHENIKHSHKESYSEELHGNLHESVNHNLKNKDIKI